MQNLLYVSYILQSHNIIMTLYRWISHLNSTVCDRCTCMAELSLVSSNFFSKTSIHIQIMSKKINVLLLNSEELTIKIMTNQGSTDMNSVN